MKDIFEEETHYHVFNHAIGKENLFHSTENYYYFLKKYAQYISPIADTLAYCLMPNHFHLLVKIKSEQVLLAHYKYLTSEKKQNPKVFNTQGWFDLHKFVMLQFQHFLNGYAKAYNKMYKRKGGLFLHFLKLKKVDNEDYFSKLIHYIHYNPVHHGFCKKATDWQFSSYNAFLSNKKSQLSRNEVLEWFGGKKEFTNYHINKPNKKFKVDFE